MMSQNKNVRAEMFYLVGSYSVQVKAIAAAVNLKLADCIGDDRRSSRELAQLVGCDEAALCRLLRALTCTGIFREEAGYYHNTPRSDTLRRDRMDNIADWARMFGCGLIDHGLEALDQATRTGLPQFERRMGTPFFDYLEHNSEMSSMFSAAMTNFSYGMAENAVAAWSFADARRIIDIGGGHGKMLKTILESAPGACGVLFDRQQVIDEIMENNLLDSEDITLVAGNFFNPVPHGGDIYILRHILHDWPDDKCLVILRNIRNAMPDRGKLLILEHVITSGDTPEMGKYLDLIMLTSLGGRERGIDEFRTLLEQAGMRLNRVVTPEGGHSIIEALPA